jgi:hypothetical protein
MQDVGRYLLFSGAQADGLPAQLHALRLGVAACAEAIREPGNGQLWQGLLAEHSKLLAKANLSDQAVEARWACISRSRSDPLPLSTSNTHNNRVIHL